MFIYTCLYRINLFSVSDTAINKGPVLKKSKRNIRSPAQ